MELKLGKMTYRELSEWFGLKPESLSKNIKSREKKLQILSQFADFHFEGKSIYIDKILIPEYNKAYFIIEKELPKHWGSFKGDKYKVLKEKKIDTCSRVGKDIYYNIPEVKAQISEQTTITYVNKVKVKNYGHNYLQDHGIQGSSRYVWMNKDETDELSEQELQILTQCKSEAYQGFGELIAEIDDEYYNGNMSKKEREKALGSLDTSEYYYNFVNLTIERLGFFPVKRTQLIDELHFDK